MNVVHAAPDVDPRLAGIGPLALGRAVEGSRFTGEGVLLVCDGTGGGLSRSFEGVEPEGVVEGSGVRWAFAGPGKDADGLIERILDSLERRKRMGGVRVVSNDKRVLAAAVGVRAKRMAVSEFLKVLIADMGRAPKDRAGKKPGGPLDRDAVRAWIREFGGGASGKAPNDWPAGIDPDDLDTGKWIKDVTPNPRPRD